MSSKRPDCPHDAHDMWEEISAWAGGIGHCRCCGFDFGIIDSGMYSDDYEATTENDPNLCHTCGGRPRVRRKGNAPTVMITDSSGTRVISAHYEDFFDPGTLGDEG